MLHISRMKSFFAALGTTCLVVSSLACVPGYEVTTCLPAPGATSCGEVVSFTGRLVVEPVEFDGETFDCDSLVGADGRRLALIYPPGWDERYRPFRLIDATGHVVAREGDVLRITYVTGGIGESVCPGEVHAAETVEVVQRGGMATPSPS